MKLRVAAPSEMPLIKSLCTDAFPKEEHQDFDTIISFAREKARLLHALRILPTCV